MSTALRQIFARPLIPLRLWGDFAMLLLLTMEAFWITDWYSALAHPQAGWAALDVFIIGTLLSSHLLARILPHWPATLKHLRVWFGAWLVLTILFSFPLIFYSGQGLSPAEMWSRTSTAFTQFGSDLGEFWHILFMILVVNRGLRLAREPLQVNTAQNSFQLGLYLLLLYGLFYGWWNSSQALITTYGFLFTGILAMSTARLSTLSDLRGGRLPPLRSAWLPGLIGVAAIVVGAAVAIGWFSTNLAGGVIAALTLLAFAAVMIVGVIVFFPVILLILSLGPTLRDLIESVLNFSGFENLRKMIASLAERIGITPAWIETVARTGRPLVLVAVLVGLAVVVVIAMVLKPWQRRWTPESAAAMLPLRVALRFPRLFAGRFRGRLPSGGRLLAAARVRWVYAQLMQLCARLGSPRPAASTPLEFLPAMRGLFPGEEPALETITQAYLQVRYGELPETYAEVQQVLLSWERIKARGKQLRMPKRRANKAPQKQA